MSILDYHTPAPLALPLQKESWSAPVAITVAGIYCGFLLGPMAYMAIFGSAHAAATTQPSAAPFGSRALVGLSIAGPCCGLAALIVGNRMFRGHAFERLGLTFRRLKTDGWKSGLLAGIFIVPATLAVAVLTDWFWNAIKFAHPSEHDLLRVLGDDRAIAVQVAIIVAAAVLAPLFEEFLFRGMIQSTVKLLLDDGGRQSARFRGWTAILVSSLLFTAIHMHLWMMPSIFFLAICLGYLYERTGNLWASMIVHSLFNATSIALFLHSR